MPATAGPVFSTTYGYTFAADLEGTTYNYTSDPDDNKTEAGVPGTVDPDAVFSWTVGELRILGGILWFVVILTLVGNMSCFYAVYKNWKKILEHPFFQSNIFCVLLSLADVLLVLLVGIPAAVFFTTGSEALGNGFYNVAVVEPILDYLVWLQLLLVVAICVDRAGHICRPLTYTFSIKRSTATAACLLCITLPFLALTLPYIITTYKTLRIQQSAGEAAASRSNMTEKDATDFVRGFVRNSFSCRDFIANGSRSGNRCTRLDDPCNIFMTCTVVMPGKDAWPAMQYFLWWEQVSHPVVLFLAILALIVSNSLIVLKLFESAAFQKNNQQRQDEVARSVRTNSIVSVVQALLLLACTLPLRVYQMEHRFEMWEQCDTTTKTNSCIFSKDKYSHHYIVIAKVLIFLGPMMNPWLYPIRMASIRSFLITKRKSVVSSARRFTISSRGSEYRSKHHLVPQSTLSKNEYVTVETADRGDNDKPQFGSSKSTQYSRL